MGHSLLAVCIIRTAGDSQSSRETVAQPSHPTRCRYGEILLCFPILLCNGPSFSLSEPHSSGTVGTSVCG